MKKRSSALSVAVATLLLVLPSTSSAVVIDFFGQTVGVGEGARVVPNAATTGAQADFLASLTTPGVETFESFSTGDGAPLNVNFLNGVTATLLGNGAVQTQPAPTTNGFGRYPISGTNFWEAQNNFAIEFDQAVRAFGFFGVDLGDFNGQLTLNVFNGATLEETLVVPYTVPTTGGGIIYYGFITSFDFDRVTFGNTAAGTDVFAFDDFTVGVARQIVDPPGGNTPVPEPSTYGLMGAALLAGVVIYRRRKAKASVAA